MMSLVEDTRLLCQWMNGFSVFRFYQGKYN